MKKYIPGSLTAIRIICTCMILFAEPFSIYFYVLYFICEISDILDGFSARRYGLQSDFGAAFDSVADFVFVLVCVVKLYGVVNFSGGIILCIICIAALKLAKAAGFVIFISVPLLNYKFSGVFACFVAGIAAINEFFDAIK